MAKNKKKELKDENRLTDNQLSKQIREYVDEHPIRGAQMALRKYWFAFYRGHHYTDLMPMSDKNERVEPEPDMEHHSKINMILGNVDMSVSKIMKESPIPMAFPLGESVEDEKVSRIVTKFFEWAFNSTTHDIGNKMYGALTYAVIFGTAWVYIEWDPLAEGGKGDFRLSVHHDGHMLPDPAATSYFDMRWVVHRYMKPIRDVKAAYPDFEDKIKSYHDEGDQIDKYGLGLNTMYDDNVDTDPYKNMCLVEIYYERPSLKNKKGEMMVIVNEDLVVDRKKDGNPFRSYDKYSMPCVPIYWGKLPNSIYGVSGVSPQIPINKDLNALVSYGMEMMKTVGGAKLMLPSGAGVKIADVEGSRQQVLEYDPIAGLKPEMIRGLDFPQAYANLRDFMIEAMMTVTGHHEVSQGQTPTGTSRISGSALKLLMDSEYLRQSPVMKRTKGSMKIMAEILSRIIKDKYEEKRQLDIVGDDNSFDLLEFSKRDINSPYDIQVQIGSALESSPSLKIEGILNIWDRQILQAAHEGMPAAKEVLRALEFGDTRKIDLEEKRNRKKAEHILSIIKEKKKDELIISSEDMHEVHMEIYRLALLDPDIYTKDKDGKLQQLIVDRIEKHRQMMNQAMMEDQQTQTMVEDSQGQMVPGTSPAGPPLQNMNANANMVAGGEGGV